MSTFVAGVLSMVCLGIGPTMTTSSAYGASYGRFATRERKPLAGSRALGQFRS